MSVHRLPFLLLDGQAAKVEMHATNGEMSEQLIASVEGEGVAHRCACELAAMVGIELKD